MYKQFCVYCFDGLICPMWHLPRPRLIKRAGKKLSRWDLVAGMRGPVRLTIYWHCSNIFVINYFLVDLSKMLTIISGVPAVLPGCCPAGYKGSTGCWGKYSLPSHRSYLNRSGMNCWSSWASWKQEIFPFHLTFYLPVHFLDGILFSYWEKICDKTDCSRAL